MITCDSDSPERTMDLGRRLGERLQPGHVVSLVGELGSGKTVFVKGVAVGAGLKDPNTVTSPTFVLISEYEGRCHVYHVDAYRMERPADFEALGADEILFGDGVCIIEWADRVAAVLPDERVDVNFEVTGAESRSLTFRAHGQGWAARWQGLGAALDAAAHRS